MADRFPQPKNIAWPLAKALGHYVYLLIDPRDGAVFYVGKGIDDRCLQHDDSEDGERKAAMIAEIKAAGMELQIDIVRHGLQTKEEAFHVEAALIDAYGLAKLTNKVAGHGAEEFGRASLGALAAHYMPEEAEIRHKVVFVKLAQTYREGISDQELYEAARGVWNLSPETARDYRYVLALWEGFVIEVYYVNRWQPANPMHYTSRNLQPTDFIPGAGYLCTEFEGAVAPADIRRQYLGKSVRSHFAAGGQVTCQYGPDV